MPDDLWRRVIADNDVRREVTRRDHLLFFTVYFSRYMEYASAPFQKDMFAITEDERYKVTVIEAFRNSAKTTIMGTSYPIWAILGKQQRKFVVILAQTQAQARQYLANIKSELESNKLLRQDLGPFEEPDDEWRSVSIVLPKYGARITIASVDQSIRGLRHGPHRPDLIICDDLEDLASVRSRETRKRLFDWLMGDIIPLGDVRTRVIVIGTRLHEDSLIMRLRKLVEEGKLSGFARSYPLISADGRPAWPGKFPDQASIDALRASVDDRAWQREYLLNIVPDDDQAIRPEWIHSYDEIPKPMMLKNGSMSGIEPRIGIDLAISQRDSADYTAIVPAMLYETHNGYRIYILPKIINKRMNFPETVETCKLLSDSYKDYSRWGPLLVIEDVAYQRALPQQLENEGITGVLAVRPGNQDKRSRLALTANLIKTGQILFPRQGAEELINQIVHFSTETHDDLADAFSLLVRSVIEEPPSKYQVFFA